MKWSRKKVNLSWNSVNLNNFFITYYYIASSMTLASLDIDVLPQTSYVIKGHKNVNTTRQAHIYPTLTFLHKDIFDIKKHIYICTSFKPLSGFGLFISTSTFSYTFIILMGFKEIWRWFVKYLAVITEDSVTICSFHGSLFCWTNSGSYFHFNRRKQQICNRDCWIIRVCYAKGWQPPIYMDSVEMPPYLKFLITCNLHLCCNKFNKKIYTRQHPKRGSQDTGVHSALPQLLKRH